MLQFVREFQYQEMSVSCSWWASRMNLINSLQQQILIIRWCCLRLSLALELDNLNCVTSSGFPFCHGSRNVCADGDFLLGYVWAQWEGLKLGVNTLYWILASLWQAHLPDLLTLQTWKEQKHLGIIAGFSTSLLCNFGGSFLCKFPQWASNFHLYSESE